MKYLGCKLCLYSKRHLGRVYEVSLGAVVLHSAAWRYTSREDMLIFSYIKERLRLNPDAGIHGNDLW